MAYTELVIKIPDRIYYGIEKGITVNGSSASQIVLDAVKHGIPLPKGHRGIVDLKNVQWAFDDAILEAAQRTGHVRATHDEIANILKTVPTIIEADAESEG